MIKYIVVFISVFALGCAENAHDSKDDARIKKMQKEALENFGILPSKMPGSKNDTPELISLGEKLYHDKRLSENNTISCNSCHRLDNNMAGVDNLPTSPGTKGDTGDRNSPTVYNAGFHIAQFWDGRAKDLHAQAKGPVLNPIEMAMPDEKTTVDKLGKIEEYADLFAKAFPDAKPGITYENMAEAIAAFERTLITKDRFDDFLKGDLKALNNDELIGLNKFITVGCITCHKGPLLGGDMYNKMGLLNPYENDKDLGLFNETQKEEDKHFFKVPSLRNIALTGPYFHDGAVSDLSESVAKMAHMQLNKKLNKIDIEYIVGFLKTLSDKTLASGPKTEK